MPTIAPTITADNKYAYQQQIERVEKFADCLHIDFADGLLAPTKLLGIPEVYWPKGISVDFHLMYQHPGPHIDHAVMRVPRLVILHAEAKDQLQPLLVQIKEAGIMAGLAFLPPTNINDYRAEIAVADHALVFGGHLGYQGGEADLHVLEKIPQLKAINPGLEIGWDGGVNDHNLGELIDAGVDIINVGGFIHSAEKPKSAYAILQQIANG